MEECKGREGERLDRSERMEWLERLEMVQELECPRVLHSLPFYLEFNLHIGMFMWVLISGHAYFD